MFPKIVGAGLAPAQKGFNCRGTAPPCPRGLSVGAVHEPPQIILEHFLSP